MALELPRSMGRAGWRRRWHAGLPSRALLLVFVACLALAPPLRADRRDQKAADLYSDGVALIKKGKYKEGADKVKAAIDHGATEPNEQQGSEGRFIVRKYDPYYWLGVAQMEMGLDEQALTNFEKSETYAVIAKWKDEYADLKQRKAKLEQKLAGPVTQPTVRIALAPTATPVRVAVLPPTPRPTAPPPPPVPTATVPIVPVIPGVPTLPPLPRKTPPTPPPQPTPENPLLLAVRSIVDDYRGWIGEPAVGGAARGVLSSRLAALEKTVSAPGKPRDAELRRVLEEEKRYFEAKAAPVLRKASLEAGLEALAAQRWDDALAEVRLARRADPRAPQSDALECAVLATRFVLEGKRDPIKIQTARERLKQWQAKVGPSKPLPAILSPSLREALQ